MHFCCLHSNYKLVCSLPVSRALALRMSFSVAINRCQNVSKSFTEAVKYCLDAMNKKTNKQTVKQLNGRR